MTMMKASVAAQHVMKNTAKDSVSATTHTHARTQGMRKVQKQQDLGGMCVIDILMGREFLGQHTVIKIHITQL